jgi:hypothetical protein
MGFQKPAQLRQKARYAFVELVRPDCFVPYSIEQCFGIFRWMVATANGTVPTAKETGRWGASNPQCLLNMHPTCVNDYDVSGVGSIAQLGKRFHFALLSRDAGASARRWRLGNGIGVTEQKILCFPHYAPFCGAPLQGKLLSEQDTRKALDGLLESSGILTTQLNSYHAAATEIYGVKVHVSPEGFTFTLEYGYDGSIWHHQLAVTPNMWEGEDDTFRRNPYGRKSEPFINTLDRAISALAELTKPEEVA